MTRRANLIGRLKRLPPCPSSEITCQGQQARARRVDLIDLGLGDPDSGVGVVALERLGQR